MREILSAIRNMLGALGIVFVVLKLTGYIAWSWWLVLLPIYGGAVIFIGAIVLYLAYSGIKSLWSKSK